MRASCTHTHTAHRCTHFKLAIWGSSWAPTALVLATTDTPSPPSSLPAPGAAGAPSDSPDLLTRLAMPDSSLASAVETPSLPNLQTSIHTPQGSKEGEGSRVRPTAT